MYENVGSNSETDVSLVKFEYTINQVGRLLNSIYSCTHHLQGIAPTLVYPVPSPERYWLLSKIIKSIRDYYPLWQVRYP